MKKQGARMGVMFLFLERCTRGHAAPLPQAPAVAM